MSAEQLKYFTGLTTNTTSGLMNADIKHTTNINFVQNASQWVCSVERVQISTSTIPAYPAIEIPFLQETPTDPSPYSMSIPETFNFLGFWKTWNDQLPQRLKNIPMYLNYRLQIPTVNNTLDVRFNDAAYNLFQAPEHFIQTNIDPVEWQYISTQEINLANITNNDQLTEIIITSNLPTDNDRYGQFRPNVLANIPYKYNLSFSGDRISLTPRNRYIWQPKIRSWETLNFNGPINVFELYAWYKTNDGKVRRILLPPQGLFEVKMMFVEKKHLLNYI